MLNKPELKNPPSKWSVFNRSHPFHQLKKRNNFSCRNQSFYWFCLPHCYPFPEGPHREDLFYSESREPSGNICICLYVYFKYSNCIVSKMFYQCSVSSVLFFFPEK